MHKSQNCKYSAYWHLPSNTVHNRIRLNLSFVLECRMRSCQTSVCLLALSVSFSFVWHSITLSDPNNLSFLYCISTAIEFTDQPLGSEISFVLLWLINIVFLWLQTYTLEEFLALKIYRFLRHDFTALVKICQDETWKLSNRFNNQKVGVMIILVSYDLHKINDNEFLKCIFLLFL